LFEAAVRLEQAIVIRFCFGRRAEKRTGMQSNSRDNRLVCREGHTPDGSFGTSMSASPFLKLQPISRVRLFSE